MDLLSESEAKRLIRRIDMRVLPTLFIIYVAAFLDRANISNALTMSMPKELGLSGDQPNVALAVFFVPYIIFEIPSNILMKKFKPHIWLSLCVAGFGIVTIAQGFVRNYAGLITTRFFLGFFEAGVFPGSFYLISFWYKQEEAQKRFTFYFCSVIIASSFGGLLATGIANMNNVRGLSNWRWIFILEGIGTVLVGAASYFFIVDFPSDAKWLSESERQFVLQRTRTSESTSERVTWKDMGQFFRDPKNILAAIMYFSVVVPIYAFAYFTPTIVKTLGYSVIQTQLHSVPPFAAALGFCLVLAILSDYTNKRVPYVLFGSVTLIAGLAVLMTNHTNFSVRYAGICLVCMGAYGAAPMIVCWYLMNLQGHKQRSIGSGWMISFGNTGGILAPFTFLTKFAPYYRTGYSVCMAVVALGTISTISYATLIVLERRKVSDNGGKLRGLAL
ncbi:putative allantoate permease [Corynespora cassiicola Philippines]|uniref:Putative allantoate permease n=1 Tax=Corynespora cassiicola Philippines TaxID=1448308 RepID=A0A2T2NH62_CORCC|nr:putative allantoate permease [Corynespora cassiicola Philippines]